jgi:hypothetical protein
MEYGPTLEHNPPSLATVSAVAEAKDADPMELPPLFDSINPDDLDGLVTGANHDTDLSITFEYAGCRVTIDDGEIDVEVQ